MTVNLTRESWALAVALAAYRRRSNDGTRRPEQDRGHNYNLIVDAMGLIGEIASVMAYKHQGLQFDHNLCPLLNRAVKDADLTVYDPMPMKVDVKAAFLWNVQCDRENRYLLAYDRGMDRIVRDNVHTLPVLTNFGADIAYVGKLVSPQEMISTWEVPELPSGNKPYAMPITRLIQENFGAVPEKVKMDLRPRLHRVAFLEGDLDQLPPLDQLPAWLAGNPRAELRDIAMGVFWRLADPRKKV